MIRFPDCERLAHPALRVAERLGLVEHRLHVRRRAAVQRAGERADRRRERRSAIGAGRGDHARGERRGVEAVLGGADPVGVDRLHVPRVGLAAPAQQEALGRGLALRDHVVRTPARGRRPWRPSARRSPSSPPRGGRGPRGPARRRSRSACRASTRRPAAPSRPAGRQARSRSARRARTARGRASSSRGRRRPAGPRPPRTGNARRAPRCRSRDSGASPLRGRARRSPSRRRRRPRDLA